MTYQEFVTEEFKKFVNEHGGVRSTAKAINLDPSIISKILNGKYAPKPKTLKKYLPGLDIPEVQSSEKHVNVICKQEFITITCKDLDELKEKLSAIGYELIIQKKKD